MVTRRRLTILSGVGVLIGASAFMNAVWLPARTALGEAPDATPLDATTAAGVEMLRRVAGLDDNNLAGLNPSNGQLRAVLENLSAWYQAHDDTWLASEQSLSEQRARVRRLRLSVIQGCDADDALATAEAHLSQLAGACQSRIAELDVTVLAALDDSQRALLHHLRSAADMSMPYRVLNLSAEQRAALTRTVRRYRQRLATAPDAETRSAAAAEFAAARAHAIGAENMQQLAALRSYRGAAADRVIAAVRDVLAVAGDA
jgi:hypothetical protein